jgi:TonB family protein
MDANRTFSGSSLKSELARFCLPAANRDLNRKLAWTNSICILFLIIGLAGARSPLIKVKTPPPLEQVVPLVVEPLPPPPTTEDQPRPEEQSEQKSETPQVVVVTPDAPSINFSVPTIGNLVVPNAVAVAPPAEPMKTPAPLRNVPKVIETTGKGGDRPLPAYPELAKQMGQQGRVVISFTVDEAGRVVSATVKESSGFPILDRNALDSVKRHWVFPPGPPDRLFEAPINYILQH